MRRNEKAIAGFFLDVPALLAILIGLSIFTLSIFHAQQNYNELRENESMERKLQDFIKNIRTSSLTVGGGKMRASTIENLNISSLKDKFPPDQIGFDYNITIQDNSQYDEPYYFSFQTSDKPKNDDIYSTKSPITIEEGNGASHLASLRVLIW